MAASIHLFPSRLAKLEVVDGLADRLSRAVATISPDSELAVPALCSVIYRLATQSDDSDIRHGAVRALRVVANLIEESGKAEELISLSEQEKSDNIF